MGTDGIRSIRTIMSVASAWASFIVPLLKNLPDCGICSGWLLLMPDEMDDLRSKQVTK